MTEITRSRVGVNTYLAPPGSLADALTLEALEQEVHHCIENSEIQLIIDLDMVPTLNSKILELLFNWQDKLLPQGGALTLVNANSVNLEVFNITGLSSYINIATQSKSSLQQPEKNTQNKRMGDLLIEEQLATAENIDKALQIQSATGKRMGAILGCRNTTFRLP